MKQQNVRVCTLSGERGDGDLLPTVNGARQGQGTGKSPRVRPHGSPLEAAGGGGGTHP